MASPRTAEHLPLTRTQSPQQTYLAGALGHRHGHDGQNPTPPTSSEIADCCHRKGDHTSTEFITSSACSCVMTVKFAPVPRRQDTFDTFHHLVWVGRG
jgi:hypothetical protein